jgi:benzoyl-CoA 2,3-dioxygenase component A
MIEIDQEQCSGCNYCTISCGQEALVYDNYQIIVDPEKCELCGACMYYCPNKAIRVLRED